MSDHFSGPRALAGSVADICDVYAFPSPDRPRRLVLVMTVQPAATPDSCFSDAIVCRFRLRPLEIRRDTRSSAYGPEESGLVFACTFAERPGALRTGRCTSPFGETAAFAVNDAQGGRDGGLRVYAGLRSDPFFIDVPAYLESLKTGRLAFTQPGQNAPLGGMNVLSIVLEVDCGPLLERTGTPLLAVVGETVVAGKLPIRIERFDRPEIKNVIMFMQEYDQVDRDLEIRDLYNLEDPFHLSKDYRGAYRARLNANLAAIDRLDGKTDWPLGPGGEHPLTDLLLDDYMVLDLCKPFAPGSCLEIERALLQGREHQTCGGRSLNDDMMDTLFTLLINADQGHASATAWTRRRGRRPTCSPTWRRRWPQSGRPPSAGGSVTAPPDQRAAALEVDDIQAPLLHPRPTRYAGAVTLVRIDDPRAGRELLRRLIPFVPSAAGPPDPERNA